MTLLDMQRDMRRWLYDGGEHAALRLGKGAGPGLRVYQNNYRAQLVVCLEESFAQTLAWIGGEAFHEAVVRHVDRVPPSSWTLDAYPRDFPATLRMLHPDDGEVAELAWLELALAEAFVGPDADVLTSADVATNDWDEAILCFTPTLDIGEATTNAAHIWSALTQGSTPPPPATLPEPGAVIVWRRDLAPHFRSIDAVEHAAIVLMLAGASFGTLCAALVAQLGEEKGVGKAGACLGQWLADGLLMDVRS